MTRKLLTIIIIAGGVFLCTRDVSKEKYPTSKVTTQVYNPKEGYC